MKKKLDAIINILFGKYTIIQKNGVELLVDTSLNKQDLRKAACLFFKEAHSL